MQRHKAAIFGHPERVREVYGLGRLEALAQRVDLLPEPIHERNFDAFADRLADVRVAFGTWGVPRLDATRLAKLPKLEVLLYAAGSVQGFAAGLLERGVKVSSAWHANAIPVSQYTVAQIVLANKGFFHNARQCSTPQGRAAWPFHGRGNFGQCVGLIGAGAVGRAVISLLKQYPLEVAVYDPFLTTQQAAALGVTKSELDPLFARCSVVSNHLPNKPELRHVLGKKQFEAMADHATFINTGRGAQVDEAALADVFRRRPDLTALLDVTDPEPPAADSPLYSLPNVVLTSHIAGALGHEVVMLADRMIAAYDAWASGQPLPDEITAPMLATLA